MKNKKRIEGSFVSLSIIILAIVPAIHVAYAQTFAEIGSLNLSPWNLSSAVIDPSHGFTYFGTQNTGGIIARVRLSDFTLNKTLNLNAVCVPYSELCPLSSAVIDKSAGFAYFGTTTLPGLVVKINLSNFTEAGTLTLPKCQLGQGSCSGGLPSVIDPASGFAYFAINANPGIIVRIRLSDFTVNETLTLSSAGGVVRSGVIDTAAGFAYFGTGDVEGSIVRVRLSNFTDAGSITPTTPNPGANGPVSSAVINPVGEFGYFATDTVIGGSPKDVVVKVRLSDFTEAGDLTNFFIGTLSSALIDPAEGFAYFGTNAAPSMVARLRLSDFTLNKTLTFNSGENYLSSVVVDAVAGFAYYFGFLTGLVVKVEIVTNPTMAATISSVSCLPSTVPVDSAVTCAATVTDTSMIPATPTGTVTFTGDSPGAFSPTGCNLEVRNITGTSTCSVDYTPSGSGTQTIDVSYSGDASHETSSGQFRLIVTTRDFQFSVATPVTFISGSKGTSMIVVSPLSGFSSTVVLTYTATPGTGLSVSFSPQSIPYGSGSSTATFSSSTPGSYTVTITGTGGSVVHEAVVLVTVAPSSPGDFVITATSATVPNTGQLAISTITVTGIDGFMGTVNLSDSPDPALTCTGIDPPTIIGSGTALLSCKSGTIGTYAVTVRGTNGSTIHTTTITVTVGPTLYAGQLRLVLWAGGISAASVVGSIVAIRKFLRKKKQEATQAASENAELVTKD